MGSKMTQAQQTLMHWVEESENTVFFGGAGVSTESGIPDFRSEDGLYRQKYSYPPETILSHSFFEQHTEAFFAFYREKMLCLDAQPNTAHRCLARWESEGRLAPFTAIPVCAAAAITTPPVYGTAWGFRAAAAVG